MAEITEGKPVRGGANSDGKDTIENIPVTTKGDIVVYDGSEAAVLPVGSDGQVLKADAAEDTGVKWAAEDVELNPTFDTVQMNIAVDEPAHSEGKMFWTALDKTLALMTDISGVIIRVGHEILIKIVNKTGVQLDKGAVVYINGAQGNRATAALADANLATSHKTIGVVVANIADNAEGYIIIFGQLRGIDTSGFTAGDDLFLSETAGELVNVAPAPPAHEVNVCVALNSTVNGTVDVNIHSAPDINDIHDVVISGLADDDILQYDSASSTWKNITLADLNGQFDHTLLQNIGSNSHVQIDSHIADAAKHREIDDGSTGVTNLWSGNKIDQEITAVSSGYSRRAAVITIVDNTQAPPTEVLGDRYILDDTGGGVNAAWDGASINDIVEFNGSTWDATTPSEGWIAYADTDNKDALFVDDGAPAWELRNVAVTSHLDLTDIGSKTHAEIDTHLNGNGNDHSSVANILDCKEPNGFPNRTDSDISFVNGTRTFTIAPAVSTFDYYIKGVKYTKSGSEDVIIPDTEGSHFIYYNGSALTDATSAPAGLVTDYAFIAIIIWDATNNEAVIFGEERHGILMSGGTHDYLHNALGTAFISGLTLGDFDSDGTGNDNSNAQFSVANGEIRDEDIPTVITDGSPQDISPIVNAPVCYLDGANGDLRKTAANTYPVKPAAGGSNRLAYNEWTGATWQQTEIGQGNFVLCHIFATNDITNPVVAIQGQEEYANISSARAGAEAEVNNLFLSALPIQEMIPVATVIYQTSTAYSNAVQARVRTTDSGDDYINWTTSGFTASSGVTDPLTQKIKRLAEVVTLSISAGAVTPNALTAKTQKVTLTENLTVNAPTNPEDGMELILVLQQDGTGGRTLTLNAVFALSEFIDSVDLSTTADKIDIVGFIYDSSISKWLVAAFNKGFN